MLGYTGRPIPCDDTDTAVSGGFQSTRRLVGHVRIDVNRRHVLGSAGQLRQERGVVAGACSDLQHAVTRSDIELIQHHRDDERSGCAGQRRPVLEAVCDHCFPGVVGVLDVGFGDELMARHFAQDAL